MRSAWLGGVIAAAGVGAPSARRPVASALEAGMLMRRTVGLTLTLLAAAASLGVLGCGDHDTGVARLRPTLHGHVVGAVIRPSFEAVPRGQATGAFAFFDPHHAVATTPGHALLLSDDGGHHWQRVGRLDVDRIQRVTATTAYAQREHRLLRSDDRGRHWRQVGRQRGEMSFADPRHAWFRAFHGLQISDDGGRTVRRVRFPCGDVSADENVYEGMSRVSASEGYVMCAYSPGAGSQLKQLYVTRDGGRHFRRLRGAAVPVGGYLRGIDFDSRRHGFMITRRGGTWETTDGGRHWRGILFDGDEIADTPQRLGPRTLVAGLDGVLVRTVDDGRTWDGLRPRTLPYPASVSRSSSRDAIGIGWRSWSGSAPYVVTTADGGATWRRRAPLPVVGDPAVADAGPLIRASPRVVFAVLTTDRGGILLRSDDDGRRWRRLAVPGGVFAATIAFADPRHGLVIGEHGRTLATDDGGRTWTVRRTAGRAFTDLAMFDGRRGLATDGTTVFATGDGGHTWHPIHRQRGLFPGALATWGPSHGWIVMGRGRCRPARGDFCEGLLRTADGGASWQWIPLDHPLGADDLTFTSTRDGAAGPRVTHDGGRTWRPAPGF